MSDMLVIKDVVKTYNKSYKALNGINLNVKSGEIFALLGPNGAGKSTLINSICGVVNFDSGTITVDGHDVIKDWRIAKSIIGHQNALLFLHCVISASYSPG